MVSKETDSDNKCLDDAYYCMVCNSPFQSPLFSITKSEERMHFFGGERLPEAEVLFAEGIGTYCSKSCLKQDRDRLLQSEHVKATFPGPGPIESCSRCGAPVDMCESHDTWTQEQDVAIDGALDVLLPIDAVVLAVACRNCSQVIVAADSQREDLTV